MDRKSAFLYLCSMKTYVDVIVPLPVAGLFTYSLPDEWVSRVCEGCRVVVSFGPRRYYTAIVVSIHHTPSGEYEIKDISEVLDREPMLLSRQYRFWKWLSEYYLCPLGDVYKAAVPSGMKLESETQVVINPDFEADGPLPPKEQQVLDLLSADAEQCITQLEKGSGIRNILPVVKSLLEKEAIFVREELKRNYKPRTEERVRLAPAFRNEKALHIQMDLLKRSLRQQQVLMKYLEMAGWGAPDAALREVSRKELQEASGATSAIVKQLVGKGVFELYRQEVGRLQEGGMETCPPYPLSEAQQTAFQQIMNSFHQKNVCLLHGVTASGKTEIYIHLILQAIQAGKQVLYLLPEIALTTQITERLRRVFGNRLGVYHSKFPDAERVEIWKKQLSENDYDVILGVRSSVFLPFRRLGLVIVDEEHETTYKQQDPAPRYHARNAAIVLASMYGAKTLLGTATPSIETYYQALHGKYAWVELKERHRNLQLPHIELVDTKELARKKRMTAQFSPVLLGKIREALENREQVILFQNRRGFAPMIECHTCGWVPKCKHCDVSLTYHKGLNQLTCHYCGATYQVPKLCPACGGVELRNRGFGTEKIEDDIRQIFPEARVARMDLDTTRTRTAYERIIADFQAQKTDILIGTQMVSKGLDFEHVSVVGILNADSMLNYPDFRSYERAFQLMAQVAGRAGRKNKQGWVVLQTKSPELPVIHQVLVNDYEGMYREQLEERALFKYPPFYRLIYVYLKHRKEEVLTEAADWVSEALRKGLGERILGPDRPPVARIQTWFIRKIMIKVEPQVSLGKVRTFLLQVQQAVLEEERFRSLQIYYDVDPM